MYKIFWKACFLTGFSFLLMGRALPQNQAIADSVKRIVEVIHDGDSIHLARLKLIAARETDPAVKEKFADRLIKLAEGLGEQGALLSGYLQKGNADRLQGNNEAALASYFKSSAIAIKIKDLKAEGALYSSIADIYSITDNKKTAFTYYNKGIATLRKSGDMKSLATAIMNAGDEYLNNKVYDSALLYFEESEQIFRKIDYGIGQAYNLGNIGMVYANIGQKKSAEKNINEAINLLEQLEDFYPICVYLLSMADIYSEKNDLATALRYAQRSLELANKYGLKEQISEANLKLSRLYEQNGDYATSFKYYKSHIVYRDSGNNLLSVQQMADLRTDYEVSKKQVEVDLLNQQKKNQRDILISLSIILVLSTILLGTLYWYYRSISRQKKISEKLLLNILPAETAIELKRSGKVEAVRFDQVTVLFTDFVQFTRIAEFVEPEQLVKSIDFYFKGFDEITTKFGLEKIKTVGDSYMCACGLPTVNHTHARNVILAAKEMIELVRGEFNAVDGLSHFEVRIGVHTGPVVAGIVGIKKWQYDIWGDTVNIASRMESMSKPGRINISETTYQQIKEEFSCEYRDEIEVKHRGLLKMYFIN